VGVCAHSLFVPSFPQRSFFFGEDLLFAILLCLQKYSTVWCFFFGFFSWAGWARRFLRHSPPKILRLRLSFLCLGNGPGDWYVTPPAESDAVRFLQDKKTLVFPPRKELYFEEQFNVLTKGNQLFQDPSPGPCRSPLLSQISCPSCVDLGMAMVFFNPRFARYYRSTKQPQ